MSAESRTAERVPHLRTGRTDACRTFYASCNAGSPVEYPIEAGKGLLSRRCIGKDTGSYKEGMDNLLHESADGVLIGELETPEAVQAALRAAKMGLVVLGTVNSVDADTAVERIAHVRLSIDRCTATYV